MAASRAIGFSGGGDIRATLALSPKQHLKNSRIQFASVCWCIFLAGWNDGSTGPLLPRIQKVYDVGFAIVSLLFVFACLGFVGGALMNVYLTDRLGFGTVCSLCQIVAYTLQAPALPFPVFVLSYTINGVGMALQEAQANGYVASLEKNAATQMGFLHAAYGARALASPLVATQFAQRRHWSFHYLVSLGLAVSNAALLSVVFKFKTQDETGASQDTKFRQIMGLKSVRLLAFFVLVYVGVEVTIGAGYVSSGFFGGMMVGRVALLWLNEKIGERRVLYLYSALAIGQVSPRLRECGVLELIVWLVPSLIGGAIAVSIVGVLLGPIFPIAMNHAARVFPRWLLTGAIGWIAGFGQAGSALIPFVTGTLSSRFGIKSLQPLLMVMMSIMIILWALVPRARRAD
ncbi:MFS general substrate transporter [Infundibulicybe gibba]|nr:MFS general substrate transporter [Infundibulicybe gibba]